VDNEQVVVVTDHDSRVLARRTFRSRAWQMGAGLDWAGAQAAKQGIGQVAAHATWDGADVHQTRSFGRRLSSTTCGERPGESSVASS
jgi:hypothetical protein